MKRRDIIALAVFLLLVVLTSAFGALVTSPGAWYAGLDKPPWTPPNWLFGPVWTVLYIMIAVAAFLVWRRAGGVGPARWAFVAWGVQLALNAAWSWIFFSLRRPDWAFIEIAVLFVAIVVTMVLFARWSRPAMGLLVPYLFWVSFAAALTLRIWQLNGPTPG
ncbi:MAG: TspO/MBR family protein [Acidobacteriota bacterium]